MGLSQVSLQVYYLFTYEKTLQLDISSPICLLREVPEQRLNLYHILAIYLTLHSLYFSSVIYEMAKRQIFSVKWHEYFLLIHINIFCKITQTLVYFF